MHFSRLIVVIAAASSLQGCAARDASPQTLLSINEGATIDEVHSAFKCSGMHQFTADIAGIETSGERYWFSGKAVCLIYEDGKLSKMVESPPAPMKRVPFEGGGWIQVPEPFDPENRLELVLNAPAMTHEDVQSLIDEVEQAKRRRAEGSEPGNIMPAVVLTAPLWVPATLLTSPFAAAAGPWDAHAAARPWRIRIGMTPAQVNAALGKPLHILNNAAVYVYGKKSEFQDRESTTGDSLIAVQFDNGAVSRVFSHGFFNPGLKGIE